MKNKDNNFKTITIVLMVILIGLSGFIIYNQVYNNSENKTINNTNKDTSVNQNDATKTNEDYSDLLEILKDKTKKVYEYYDVPAAFCGKADYSDTVANVNDYGVSTQFKSYNEVMEYLKSFMNENVISAKKFAPATSKDLYLEKNGNLYCKASYKGGGILGGMSLLDEISIQLEEITDTQIKTEVLIMLSMDEGIGQKTYDYLKYNINFENKDDNWIVSLFEKQD